ncbi:MAG: putative lipid II flippase FtsW [Pseudomonadota bacterium]
MFERRPAYAPAAPAAAEPARRTVDPWLVVSALALAGVGLVMVFSSSSAIAEKRHLDAAYFMKHQAMHLAVGLAVMTFLATRDHRDLGRWSLPLIVAVFLSLVLVLIPGLGHRAGGAARWLRLGYFSLQPAELAKLALVIYLARFLSLRQNEVKSLTQVFLPALGVALALILPVLAEPDLGMSVTLMVLALAMLFVAGARTIYLAGLVLISLPPLYLLVTLFSYRLKRLLAFLDPWADPNDSGFQIIHSFMALGSGGLMGAGLGGSVQKLFYLPEPHTDFILSVLGEELGLMGILGVLALFMVLIWRGLGAALACRDAFGSLLALGCTLIIGLQAFVNAGVVMGLLPTKGLTLPFISYGGSSLIVNLACVGILMSVAASRERE